LATSLRSGRAYINARLVEIGIKKRRIAAGKWVGIMGPEIKNIEEVEKTESNMEKGV
jgi:phosphoribosylamine-glycine ligase